jgi:hypothetical protein
MAGVISDPNGPQEWSLSCTERFPTYTASHGNAAESRLAGSSRKPYISTAVAPNGKVVAAATRTEVRIYCSECESDTESERSFASTPAKEIEVHKTPDIKLISRKEEIRAVALSDSLLAVLTYNRLIVYECGASGDVVPEPVVDKTIDQNGKWTPKSLCVSQKRQGRVLSIPSDIWAWIAVGGDGVNSVKLFRLQLDGRWNLQNDRPDLKCTQNMGSMKIVGFSPNQSSSPYASIVVGVTTSNEVYFWDLRKSVLVRQKRTWMPTWRIPGSSIQNVPVSYTKDHFWGLRNRGLTEV